MSEQQVATSIFKCTTHITESMEEIMSDLERLKTILNRQNGVLVALSAVEELEHMMVAMSNSLDDIESSFVNK
jgi:hypothetical protein